MNRMALPDPKLLTVQQVAKRLQVSVRTVWRFVRAGRLPRPCYPGKRSPRWSSAAIDAQLGQPPGEGGDA
jgi:excisionase family DNA binding protein